VIIKSLKEGSTIIEFEIAAPSGSNASSLINFLSSKLSSVNSIGDYSIISI